MYINTFQQTYPADLFEVGNEAQLAVEKEKTLNTLKLHLNDLNVAINLIYDIDRLVITVIKHGHINDMVRCNGIVVKDGIEDELVKTFHPLTVATFKQSLAANRSTFYVFTRGEDWWQHEHCFYVYNDYSYMLALKYYDSKRSIEIRDYKSKDKGGTGFKDWVELCVARKEEIAAKAEEVKILELSINPKVAEAQASFNLYIDELKAPLLKEKAALAALRAQPAPKRNVD